jgi:hypothetical protein
MLDSFLSVVHFWREANTQNWEVEVAADMIAEKQNSTLVAFTITRLYFCYLKD